MPSPLTPHRSWVFRVTAAVGVGALSAGLTAQQRPAPAPTPPTQGGGTFRSVTRLTVQTVSVKDKDGRPVEGLTVKDFAVTEDGEPQAVSFAEFERLPTSPAAETVAPADPLAPALPPTPRAAVALPPVTDTRIATSAPGSIRYGGRRLLVLYFDLTSGSSQDQLRSYNGARKFITTEMTPADLIAVIAFQGGGVHVKQDFTDQTDTLLDVLDRL